jgi:predicted TIM-barrel fold metal-dependent hydrolase
VLDRRELLRGAIGGVGLCLGVGCGGDADISDEEVALLEERTRAELARSGQGHLGPLRVRGYRGLAELPWFELDSDGRPRLVADDIPAGIDLHTHLGIALGLAPQPDLHAATASVSYLLDCDGEPGGCDLDLDVYMNLNFTPAQLRGLRIGAVRQLTIGNPDAATHTLPNLAAELDAAGFERAAILPIRFGLPFGSALGDDLAERWLEALAESPHAERFVPGGSVHPREPERLEMLRAQARRGARIVKLHPEMQRFYPWAPEAMEIYAECERIGLPVFFHAGRSGIEPERIRPYALLRHLEEPAASFPRLPIILGHGGARDLLDAIPLARRHANVHLGIASLGSSAIARLLDELGPERIVFGSDWPFYPVNTSLAKLLWATRDRPEAREPILRGNALRLFASLDARRQAFLTS